MTIESRMRELGLVLPGAFAVPGGATFPFAWVRVHGNRAFVSGHAPLNADGSLAEPLGKVGAEVTIEQASRAARLTGLAMLASLQRELGQLDRITGWLRVFGMVNAAPGFSQMPTVINGFSDLIIQIFGKEVGMHSRSAVGMAELPFRIPVEIEAEVEVRP